jgi:hypothetical protein
MTGDAIATNERPEQQKIASEERQAVTQGLTARIIMLLLDNHALSDRDITERLFGSDARHQYVNATCRHMETKGFIKRVKPVSGPIMNCIVDAQVSRPLQAPEPSPESAPPLSEHALKFAIKAHLETEGWEVSNCAWGKSHGVDLDAKRSGERWLIEVKGIGSLSAMRANYFLGILGEILQRMDDPKAKYSIALPDVPQFRNLWKRLPALAKSRTGISALFIDADGNVAESS